MAVEGVDATLCGLRTAPQSASTATLRLKTASTKQLVSALYTTIHPASVDFLLDDASCTVIPVTKALNSTTSSTYPGSCDAGTLPVESRVANPPGKPLVSVTFFAASAVALAASAVLCAVVAFDLASLASLYAVFAMLDAIEAVCCRILSC